MDLLMTYEVDTRRCLKARRRYLETRIIGLKSMRDLKSIRRRRGLKSTRRRRRRRCLKSRTDLISQLPPEIKDCILERLSTRDAARTALLSTQWRDVWLSHERLVFDLHFFTRYTGSAVVKIINHILMQRAGPVRKFTMDINVRPDDFALFQSYLDLWFPLLSTNGIEELTIFSRFHIFQLPTCIFSCQTIKKLDLLGFRFTSPSNTPRILPNVTSLTLKCVHFNHNDPDRISVVDIPNLETLSLGNCTGIAHFCINSPKLVTLISGSRQLFGDGCRWFSHYCTMIQTLWLHLRQGFSVGNFMLPNAATNLRVLNLQFFCFEDLDHLNFVMLLLRRSTHLRELHIIRIMKRLKDEEAVRMLEHLNFTNEDIKTVSTLTFKPFFATRAAMLFVKAILSTPSALRQVVIHTSSMKSNRVAKELLCFPRASQDLQLVLK